MNMISRSPVYNLSAVLKETGLKSDILRAWERRYALPKPQRTAGGHRIYSEYDIRTVKWLKARQLEGLIISRAVELWKELIDSGIDPFTQYSQANTTAKELLPVADARIDILRKNWLEACYKFDSSKAEDALNQAFALYPVETVCTAILQKALNTIGNEWYLGQASVQQEHFASALAIRRIETLITATPPPTREQVVLIGCPPGEWHTFPTLLLNLLLRRNGLKVIYLGADVPLHQLEDTAHAIHLNLVILAAQQLTTAASLQSAALLLQEIGVPLSYGGHIFNRLPRLQERIPAYYLGENLFEATFLIEELVVAPISFSKIINLNETLQVSTRLFQAKRSSIEHALFNKLQKDGLQIDFILEANTFLGNGLSAALQLGDPAFLEADLEWVKRLLAGRQIPEQSLITYLAAYRNFTHLELGKAATPITEWIDSFIEQNETIFQ
jgi:methanogenic corrinoid protein MtbC1